MPQGPPSRKAGTVNRYLIDPLWPANGQPHMGGTGGSQSAEGIQSPKRSSLGPEDAARVLAETMGLASEHHQRRVREDLRAYHSLAPEWMDRGSGLLVHQIAGMCICSSLTLFQGLFQYNRTGINVSLTSG